MKILNVSRAFLLASGLLAVSALPFHTAHLDVGNEVAYAADVAIVVDGREIASDVSPTIVNGRTLVPVRAVSESLHAQVAWHNELRIVTIARDGMVLTLQVDKQEYQMNGRILTLDVPVKIIDNRAMVPIRLISESFGATVDWDPTNYRVLITNNGGQVNASKPDTNILQQNGKLRIKFNKVNIRQSPTTNSPVVSMANEGDFFALTGRTDGWFQIQRSDGSRAYVADWLADIYDPSRPMGKQELPLVDKEEPAPIENPKAPNVSPNQEPKPNLPPTVTADGQIFASLYNSVNLRSGPGTNFDKVGQVNRGAEFKSIKKENDWWQMDWQGKKVWVREDLVTKDISSIKASTSTTNGQITQEKPQMLKVIESKKELGQAWVSFHVGNAKTRVVSNNNETIIVEIDGAQVPEGFNNPVAGIAPFASMSFENVSDYAVRVTVTAQKNGYFRLDRFNERFSIMAVAKHKNGQIGLNGKTIVLDPGHGNYAAGTVDPGAVSKHNGLREIDFNTNVLMELKKMLEGQGATVLMTRQYTPKAITLAERAQLANDNSADAFISLHGDSAGNTSAFGAGTWLYTGDVRLTSAAQKDMRNEYARAINSGIAQATGRPAYIKYANFAVTRENEVPSVLVEAGFLSNAKDAQLLSTPEYQKKLAQGLYQGLENFFSY